MSESKKRAKETERRSETKANTTYGEEERVLAADGRRVVLELRLQQRHHRRLLPLLLLREITVPRRQRR